MGPQSAGANPGPACYDRGGELPTCTDADLVLGYLDKDFFAGGGIPLNLKEAEEVLAQLDEINDWRILLSAGRALYAAHNWDACQQPLTRAIELMEQEKDRPNSSLVEAKRLLDEWVDDADDETRESMLTNVRVNREILAAWREEFGEEGESAGSGSSTEPPPRTG